MNLSFTAYQPPHRERLLSLAALPAWRAYLDLPDVLEVWRAATVSPPAPPAQLRGAFSYLSARNAAQAQTLIQDGVHDGGQIARALGDWGTALPDDESWPIFFLGLVLTIRCSFDPRRCLYCNQAMLPRRLGLKQWQAVIADAVTPVPPYVYLTGGEPLLLGETVWGAEGLVAFATRRGCAVNLNTNAALITPRVALHLVKGGLARAHISLDSADPQTQGLLFGGRERVGSVWRGLFNLQIARELLGARHPQVHINCVLTRLNLFQVPDLLRFLLAIRPLPAGVTAGRSIAKDPALADFSFHLIPVGGKENDAIRPTAAEWRRFYTQTWAEMEQIWAGYQAEVGVPAEERDTLVAHIPFANPYLRVEHGMSLEEYCAQAARGVYWQGALAARCYVAPTQAYVLPDGSQHWCGAHAVRRPPPLGNVLEAPLRENMRRRIMQLMALPGPDCINCAGATCAINQSVARSVGALAADLLRAAAA